MRFIGNKELIVSDIRALLAEQGLEGQGLSLFDAFCGTGAVADALKDKYNIIANDILEWCQVYTRGRLSAPSCTFSNLGFDPFDILNEQPGRTNGFFFKNYSPGESNRMYFSEQNAARIDFFRDTIEHWRLTSRIDESEYAYLLASLIESTSAVSNTAGVYGAFLKHWDPRASRPIKFAPVKFNPEKARDFMVLNNRIEDIISDVDCDVLYLDPPYTQNQYGTQYHLLETLVKNDNPTVSAITGSRPTAPMRSDWSKDVKKHILFDRIVANSNAKHILVSYSSDGFMSKSYIEAVLKRYGHASTFECRPLSYRKYTNFKSRKTSNHLEYLFFIEKKPLTDVQYVSPLNYVGSKTRMVPFIQQHLPKNIDNFVDAFGGGFNVGINAPAQTIIYNDYNHLVAELIASFRNYEPFEYVQYIRRQIKKFGLEKENSDAYISARNYYNSLCGRKRDPRLLYTIIQYGFNQQIRFNSDMQFNNPVGQRWFNERVLEKLISFSRISREKQITYRSTHYANLLDELDPRDFVYMDPPYRLTTGAYNDGRRGFKGWDVEAEKELFDFADRLNQRSIRFMLSYVLGHKGKVNHQLAQWIKANDFRVLAYDKVQGIGREEIVILNYGQN